MNESGDGPACAAPHEEGEQLQAGQNSRLLSSGWTMRISPRLLGESSILPNSSLLFLNSLHRFFVISTHRTLGEKRNPTTCKCSWNSNSEQNTNTPSQTSLASCGQEWHRWACSSHCQAEERGVWVSPRHKHSVAKRCWPSCLISFRPSTLSSITWGYGDLWGLQMRGHVRVHME